MALSDTRSPILDYATAFPIPAYRPPSTTGIASDYILTEGGEIIQCETGLLVYLVTEDPI